MTLGTYGIWLVSSTMILVQSISKTIDLHLIFLWRPATCSGMEIWNSLQCCVKRPWQTAPRSRCVLTPIHAKEIKSITWRSGGNVKKTTWRKKLRWCGPSPQQACKRFNNWSGVQATPRAAEQMGRSQSSDILCPNVLFFCNRNKGPSSFPPPSKLLPQVRYR